MNHGVLASISAELWMLASAGLYSSSGSNVPARAGSRQGLVREESLGLKRGEYRH